MTSSNRDTTQLMTDFEIKGLRKHLFKNYLLGFLFACMFSIIYCLVIYSFQNEMTKLQFLILILLVLLIFIVTIRANKNLRIDIHNGKKILREYQIVDKISFLDREPEAEGTILRYHLITNIKRFSVDKFLFDQVKINDWIIEHETPLTKESLRIEKKCASLQHAV